MEDFNIKGYLKINKHLNQLNEVTSKEKARLQQLFQKALNDPDLDDETLNKIKNAVVSKNILMVHQQHLNTSFNLQNF